MEPICGVYVRLAHCLCRLKNEVVYESGMLRMEEVPTPEDVAAPRGAANVWSGTTLDSVQCRLNSEAAGLVAHVGKGGKKISNRVARRSTSLSECVAAMERVLDRSQTPLPSPADLHAILCGLPLLWLEAGQRFESGE